MPVTPGAAGVSFDVLLAFSLDAEANRRVQSGVSTMEAELKRLQEEAGKVGPEFKESTEQVKKSSKESAQDLRAQARAMRAEVAAISSDVKNLQIGLLRDLSSSLASFSAKSLVTGGAILGGIFAESQNFVNESEKLGRMTSETRAWAAATAELATARREIDFELLRTALPIMQQAARVATQASAFVRQHPEITSLALKSGAILVGVGVIGTAVSKGIKLVADVQYLATIPTQIAAAKLQDAAADKQLQAAGLQFKGAGGGAAKAAGGAGLLGLGVTALSSAAITGAVAIPMIKVLDTIENTISERFGRLGGIMTDALAAPLARILPGFGLLRTVAGHVLPVFQKLTDGIDLFGKTAKTAGRDLEQAAGLIRGSANEREIVEAFQSWKEDDRRIVQEAADNRKKIIADSEREIANITRSYAQERAGIIARFSKQAAEITRRFEEENQRAEEDYQNSRASILEEGARRLQELEESHQARLEQIRKEGAEAIDEAERSRDALGLVNAQRRVVEEEAEENRSFRAEAARSRRETAQRIADLDAQYAIERARRQEEYQQDLADNAAQRAEELKQAQDQYQAELRQAAEARAQQLRELEEGLQAERLRRREVFLAQIRDLDEYLLGDRAIRTRYYNESLAEAEAYFARLRGLQASTGLGNLTGSVGTIPNGDTLGAQAAIGAGIVNALLGARGDSRSVVYNDGRRMEAPISKDMRDIYRKTARDALRDAIGA